jgi:hypothetical protein
MRNFIICIFATYYKGSQIVEDEIARHTVRDENCIKKGQDRPLARCRYKWEVQDMDHWQAVVNFIMSLQIPQQEGNFLTSLATLSYFLFHAL